MEEKYIVPIENLIDDLLDSHLYDIDRIRSKRRIAAEEAFRKHLSEDQIEPFLNYSTVVFNSHSDTARELYRKGVEDGIKLMKHLNAL